jgi:hypothetical protein
VRAIPFLRPTDRAVRPVRLSLTYSRLEARWITGKWELPGTLALARPEPWPWRGYLLDFTRVKLCDPDLTQRGGWPNRTPPGDC